MLVGKEDVDQPLVDELHEIIPMPINDEAIWQREGNLAARPFRGIDRGAHGSTRLFRIPQIAFQIEDRRRTDQVEIKRWFRQKLRCAQKGVHRALSVRRHQDQAARGGHLAPHRWRVIADTEGAHIMGEHIAQLVVTHLPDEGAALAQCREASQRVRRWSAADLLTRAHIGIERLGRLRVDQLHAALGQRMFGKECVIAGSKHVDNGIADRDNI